MPMSTYVLDLHAIDRTKAALVGGKGASLGELTRLDGITVPPAFCVTTLAFERIVAGRPALDALLDQLARLEPTDGEWIRAPAAEIRRTIEAAAIPHDVTSAITDALTALGEDAPYAVRSSGTAEDLPTMSFAGQHDSYLNVAGRNAILDSVRRCWASLFTERAVVYRTRQGIDHRTVRMAVVVQRMVPAVVSGILFTADPITGNRRVATIEATTGLGEPLVSGRVKADVYSVRRGAVVSRTPRLPRTALSDDQVVGLAELGRRIESHFGQPQDIEWCLADARISVVQSRPITTLYPIPEATDGENHVYVSVGHQQMMTDAMTPLGLSVWQMTTPRPMAEAGGRLFVDVTQALASAASRDSLLATLGRSDPRISDALRELLDRGDFIREIDTDGPAWTAPGGGSLSPIETDRAIVANLVERSEASLAELQRVISTSSGTDLFDVIRADLQARKREQFDPRSLQAIMAGLEAAWWLNEHLERWLGERNVADLLTRSVPDNVTSAMGLALLDVADVIRPHAAVVALLERAKDDSFLDALPRLEGGREAREAILAWLDDYGMRAPGEIDITRPRWREHPVMLVPMLLANVKNFEAGAAARRFAQGLREAEQKEAELLTRLRALPGGAEKAVEAKRMIDRVRTFAGYREYPKYAMVSRYFVYKQALLREVDRLIAAGVLDDREDAWFLRFDELRQAVETGHADRQLIAERRAAFRSFRSLTPPRVLTSDGEMLSGRHRRSGVPTGALVGLAASSGVVEGRARVIRDVAKADLEPGDILVTAYTDPSWTPLFVAVKGLVTEVGGLTTHGAVIAREFGLPAVVGVENATQLIRDGDRIRVSGSHGWVELVTPARPASSQYAGPA
jgi:pyruvate,water dikinase